MRSVLSPVGTVEVVGGGQFSIVPTGRDSPFLPLLPSTKSLGYFRPTLRVEILADTSR